MLTRNETSEIDNVEEAVDILPIKVCFHSLLAVLIWKNIL